MALQALSPLTLTPDASANFFLSLETTPHATIEQVRNAVLAADIIGVSADREHEEDHPNLREKPRPSGRGGIADRAPARCS